MATHELRRIALEALLVLLRGRTELALLDVRENGVFTEGHAYPAVSAPLSQLDGIIAALVPRTSTSIVLMDGNDGLAEIAAGRLSGWGYRDVTVADGGFDAWRARGLEVFAGQYVPSKAFGEYVSHACKTPAIAPAELKRWLDEARDFSLVDCRPFSEFHRFALAGSVNCPGAELPHRAFALAPDDPGRPIVVTCAGRTRGIVAAQALLNAGVPNPVYVLDDGTAGWYLLGLGLEHGRSTVLPPATRDAIDRSIESSRRLAQQFPIVRLDAEGLARLSRESDRTMYVFDVRSPEEYEEGHLPGARSAPGGQLVQSLDHYVGVRNARIVLADDDGVRATFTASWLCQMGWREVFVLDGDALLRAPYLERGPEPARIMASPPAAKAINPIRVIDAKPLLDTGQAIVLDFQDSLGFRKSHPAGAWFTVRSRLAAAAATLDEFTDVICTSDDGQFAARAAIDVANVTSARVHVLDGGNRAWRAAGLPMESGAGNAFSAFDDVWYNPYDFEDLEASLKSYLRWEIDLIDQIGREEFVQFSCAPFESAGAAEAARAAGTERTASRGTANA